MKQTDMNETVQTERILARQTALELTIDEINKVSGGLETAQETFTGVQCERDSCDADL